MAKFCGKCGARVEETTGLCPRCDADEIRRRERMAELAVEEKRNQAKLRSEPVPYQNGELSRKMEKLKRKTEKKIKRIKRKEQKKAAKKAYKKEKWAQLSFGEQFLRVLLKMLLWILLISIVIGGALGTLTYFGVVHIPFVEYVIQSLEPQIDAIFGLENSVDKTEEYSVEPVDAEEYYSENGEIISKIEADQSEDVVTGAEAVELFASRKLDGYPVTTCYSIDGTYYDEIEVDSNSDELHPMYETFYYSTNDELWTVMMINDAVMAYPVSYMLQSEMETEVIISESNSITGYDSATNMFYEISPYPSTSVVICVDRIDAETLDSLTIEMLDVLFADDEEAVLDSVESVTLQGAVAEHKTLAAGDYHTVGVRLDGTVVSTGYNRYGQCDVEDWTDIVSIATYGDYTVGLRSDGTVVSVGEDRYGDCDVEDWTDIVDISAGYLYTVGLKSDGTVVATGYNEWGQCDVEEWRNIVAVEALCSHTVGLKSDGTVVATGDNYSGECDVDDWTEIVKIVGDDDHTVGLKSDGTVVATGYNECGECDVDDWTDIVDIAAGYLYTIGLKSDGTVVATGDNEDGECDVEGWTDIVEIVAGEYNACGLKSDGTVVATGCNDEGECNVEGWTDIVEIAIGYEHTVGLKSDGTVVATGDNEDGQCNVQDWRLKLPE